MRTATLEARVVIGVQKINHRQAMLAIQVNQSADIFLEIFIVTARPAISEFEGILGVNHEQRRFRNRNLLVVEHCLCPRLIECSQLLIRRRGLQPCCGGRYPCVPDSACSKSAIRSAEPSIPTETRISPGEIPATSHSSSLR